MRVITGTARGVPLKAPKGMDTRPTMDQVKEGIFSAIQFEVEGGARSTCLRVRASSASGAQRGAAHCTLWTRAGSPSPSSGRT